MKRSLRRRVFDRIGRLFGLHPDVGGLIGGAIRLANPRRAALPSENLPMASRVFATGLWNYSFFQFYPSYSGPFWVHRQYDHGDAAFIPRAGSMLSVNLTHRDWMGFRGPDSNSYSIVDPAGSVSPVVGYYTIELGLFVDSKLWLATRGELSVEQKLVKNAPVPTTIFKGPNFEARWTLAGSTENPGLMLSNVDYRYSGDSEACIVIGIRPFNCEGGAPLHDLAYGERQQGGVLRINYQNEIAFMEDPSLVVMTNLEEGDSYLQLGRTVTSTVAAQCDFGVATGLIAYRLKKRGEIHWLARTYEREYQSREDAAVIRKVINEAAPQRTPFRERLRKERKKRKLRKTKIKNVEIAELFDPAKAITVKNTEVSGSIQKTARRWREKSEAGARFRSGNKEWNRLATIYKGFLLSLHTGEEVTPGVYTYRLFWFRDAAYLLSALSGWNYLEETRSVLETYPRRQDRNGFFRSQEGEWDSNGQAIWTLVEFARTQNDPDFLKRMYPIIKKGAEWIIKRRREGLEGRILPAGWSAEHLGPADFYYWDNLWSMGGLISARWAADRLGCAEDASRFATELEQYKTDVREVSARDRQKMGCLTAAPGREPDAGMIGNLPLLYPLHFDDLLPEDELRKTIDTIRHLFTKRGLFFQSMIHSGFNIYLSIQMAQCYLRLGEPKIARRIFRAVCKARTQLFTYPEAVHPHSGGGVMGDGFHGWAFAEMLLLLRNFVIAEGDSEKSVRLFYGMGPLELIGSRLDFGPFPYRGSYVQVTGKLKQSRGELRIMVSPPGLAIQSLELYLPTRDSKKRKIAFEDLKVKGAEIQEARPGRIVLTDLTEEIELRY